MKMVTSVASKATITVLSYDNREPSGYVYNAFLNKYIPFGTTFELIVILENIFDELSFPQSSVNTRHFWNGSLSVNKNIRELGEKMKGSINSGKAKFIINVQFRQNATWQGNIEWVNGNKSQKFRSALEMLKLMDEALTEEEDSSEEISF